MEIVRECYAVVTALQLSVIIANCLPQTTSEIYLKISLLLFPDFR